MNENKRKCCPWLERIILMLTTLFFITGSFLLTPFIINLSHDELMNFCSSFVWMPLFLFGIILYTISESDKKHRVLLLVCIILFSLFALIRTTYYLGANIIAIIATFFGMTWFMIKIGIAIKYHVLIK